jgi:hypothetical protein
MAKKKQYLKASTLASFAYYVYTPPYQWLDNSDEAITLRDSKGEEIDSAPIVSDNGNDNRYWMHNNSEWIFGVTELEKGKIWRGAVKNVVDGDAVDVSFDIYGIQRIRLVGVNTPEIGKEGKEAKEYVKRLCYQKKVYLDIEDLYTTGKYGRIVAVVSIPYNETPYVNLNQLLLK